MKLSELNLNDEYAIVPSWGYASKEARDETKAKESEVVKATIYSLDKYVYEASLRKDTPDFTKAPQGERSVGVVAKGIDNNGKDIYWTTRLADIVAVYSTLEPRWEQEKLTEQKKQQEYEQRQKAEQEHRAKVFQRVEQSRVSVTNTTRELLGDNTKVNVTTNGYGVDVTAQVEISLDEYERLIELAYAGKEIYK